MCDVGVCVMYVCVFLFRPLIKLHGKCIYDLYVYACACVVYVRAWCMCVCVSVCVCVCVPSNISLPGTRICYLDVCMCLYT